jgi:integrase
MPAKRRRFGYVRKLPSGKYQASYIGPAGDRVSALGTFRTKTDADRWLARVEADLSRGAWLNEALGRTPFGEYAEAYLTENPKVGERWAETCRRNMRLHMKELLALPLVGISPPVVRTWYAAALARKAGRSSLAQSYRFLRAVMNAAVRDQAIPRNPCHIPGAGSEKAKERNVASAAQVAALVDATTPRYRAAIVLAAWCALRRGEICGLRRNDVDLERGVVWVRKNRVELLESSRKYDKEPKSEAGKRMVTVPPHVLPILVEHAKEWAGSERFFISRDGQPLRGNSLYQAFVRARMKVGVNIAFHDLRHTGQTLAAAAGASLADLKKRLGHASSAAALRYMHAVDGRDEQVAVALSELASRGDAAKLPSTIVVRH